jgi:hypothetical protein
LRFVAGRFLCRLGDIGAPVEPAEAEEPFAAAVRLRDVAQSAIARRLGA